jgi:hypothetical protein
VKVGYTLGAGGKVSLEVYNLDGRMVQILANEQLSYAGEHIVEWDNSGLAPGVYCLALRAEGQIFTQKAVVR